MSLLRNLPAVSQEKTFQNNSNSLTGGEVKHKSMRFSLDKK